MNETYLSDTIVVELRDGDYRASLIADRRHWGVGGSPREAIGALVMSAPEEIVAALSAAQRQPGAGQAVLGALRTLGVNNWTTSMSYGQVVIMTNTAVSDSSGAISTLREALAATPPQDGPDAPR